MSQQAQQVNKVLKPLYEVQSNDTTIIMTKSMREVNDAWAKSANCKLYEFDADGSKHLVNFKVSPAKRSTQFELHFRGKVTQSSKQKKPKLEPMASPVTRTIKRKRDRDEVRTGGVAE